MKNPLHPLKAWLLRQKSSLPKFSVDTGIKQRTLYDTVTAGHDPKLSTLQAIEDATGGKVTVQKISDWFKARKQK